MIAKADGTCPSCGLPIADVTPGSSVATDGAGTEHHVETPAPKRDWPDLALLFKASIANGTTGKQKWSYTTSTGSEIDVALPKGSKFLSFLAGYTMFLVWVALLMCWVPFAAGWDRPFDRLLGCLFFAWMGYLIRTALRSLDQEFCLDDSRPAILYLRAFGDDEILLQSMWQLFVDRPSEASLVSDLGCHGPVVAIGRPGEPLPPMGAQRFYVSNAHWQELISDLIVRARIVVFQAGRGDGLRWELSQIIQTANPAQVLLYFADTAAMQAFRPEAAGLPPLPTAPKPDSPRIVYFGPGWVPELLLKEQTEFHVPLSGNNALEVKPHELSCVLAELGKSDALFNMKKNYRGILGSKLAGILRSHAGQSLFIRIPLRLLHHGFVLAFVTFLFAVFTLGGLPKPRLVRLIERLTKQHQPEKPKPTPVLQPWKNLEPLKSDRDLLQDIRNRPGMSHLRTRPLRTQLKQPKLPPIEDQPPSRK